MKFRKNMPKGPPSKKALIKRAALIVLFFIASGSISYPAAANWAIDRFNAITTLKVPHLNYPVVLGLDLQGGTHLEYVADLEAVPSDERSSAMDGVRDVIERRVNQLGVSEPLVQAAQSGNEWRLTVELAGVRDVNEAIKLIGETPILEFREANEEANRQLTDLEYAALAEENGKRKIIAEQALKRVLGGEDLGAVSKEVSTVPEISSASGDLGWILDKKDYASLLELFRDKEPGLHKEAIDDGQFYYVAELLEKKDAGEEMRASHILVQWKDALNSQATSTKEEARAKIEEIQKLVNPENFTEMAMRYSEEPGADQSAGDLGYFQPGVMVESFEQAVSPLKVGEISVIVETEFGFHVIHKTDARTLVDAHVRAVVVKQKLATEIVPSEPWLRTKLTGKQLKRSNLDFDPQTGTPIVLLEFNEEGSELFAELTKKNIGKSVAIYLDGQPISIPTVQSEITGGQAVISGSFTIDEAKKLSQRLQAGALPVPINLVAQQSVGPTLGAESIAQSLRAGLIGFLLIVIFMILYYRLPGLVAVFGLSFYVALVFALFKLVPVTLSLSGIAGFILSIGIAVDANVLIFERLKEEMRTDKPLYANLEEAFKRAWPSIRDGNVTTLIVCIILYTFTSSLVKGFALTLSIGILVSMFTAVIITRSILRLIVQTGIRKYPWFFLGSKKTIT